jgi:restriction system protein
LEGFGAQKGVLITTSSFSNDAGDFVTRIQRRIVLVDGRRLAGLMIDHGVGVTTVAAYDVKRVDEDFFEPVPGTVEADGANSEAAE